MAGGTNNIKRPGYATGGPGGFRQPGFAPGGPDDPAMGGPGYMTRPGMGGGPGGMRAAVLRPGDKFWEPGMGGGSRPQVGQPNPAQMEEWKKQFGGWNPGQGQPGQFPPMNIPGLLGGGGQNNPPGFPGYDNLPKNWQDDGYSWQDPNNPNAKYNIIA